MSLIAACTVAYQKTAGKHVNDAGGYPEITTLDDCKILCNKDITCRAFDYNDGDNLWKNTRCWMHSAQKIDIKPLTNCTLHLRTPCYIEPGKWLLILCTCQYFDPGRRDRARWGF